MANYRRSGPSWSFAAMVALMLVAIVVAVNFVLGKFGVNLGVFGTWMLRIAQVISYFFVAIYAYSWAKAKRGNGWLVVYWIAVVLVFGLYVLGWFW